MREDLVYLDRLATLVGRLGLDTDTTPTMAVAYAPSAAARMRDGVRRLASWTRAAKLDQALAWVLDQPTHGIGIPLSCRSVAQLQDPAQTAQQLRESTPLALDEVMSAHLLDAPSGGVVVVKLSHLVADASDADRVFAEVCALLDGTAAEPTVYALDRRRSVDLYARPSAAAAVVEELGELPVARRCGARGRGEVRTLDVRVPERHSFSSLLSVACRALAPVVGDDQIWSYPLTPPEDRDHPGYFAQVKQVKVSAGATEPLIATRRARARIEALGRFSEGDAPALAGRLSRARTPRLVLSATSFYRTNTTVLRPLRTVSHRSLDDVRLLWDRSHSPDGALRLQYKTRFLDAPEAQDLARRLESFAS